ncbi:MAG: Glutamine--fructose-6-phosphate aminotransferase [isomerizing] [Myxococcota bacterium]|nr:Glutamine--fructose-6-phosphate aminotransferase [isomerizing] [Myxococcota bacterium]
MVGRPKVTSALLDGLRRLEYRGYDSAGVAVFQDGDFQIRRAQGKLNNLDKLLNDSPAEGQTGVGHTRWATHGAPSERNAHPHRIGDVVVVHNGIIENHLELKREALAQGAEFSSETDTEIVAHLVNREIQQGHGLLDSTRRALEKVRGAYAICVLSRKHPDELVVAKNASPLVIGVGEGENYVASDIPALLPYTRDIIFLEEGEMARITREKVELFTLSGETVNRRAKHIHQWSVNQAEKAGHKHFMIKEIHEQPRAVIDTLRGRLDPAGPRIYLDDVRMDQQTAERVRRAVIVACGTSYHAGLIGKFIIEELARLPVEVDVASEYRYRRPIVDRDMLFLAISQSGETADTHAALRESRKLGARVMSVCNVVDSSIARDSDDVLYTHAGPEISVASTKAFTTQIVALALVGLRLAELRDTISSDRYFHLTNQLLMLPGMMEDVLKHAGKVKDIAQKYMNARDFLYLGRGINYPVALEGALKLKEISYIHAEGYPAGEMKHGPIALIDDKMPVVVLATRNESYEKMLSNIQEVRSRGGKVIAIVTRGDQDVISMASDYFEIPAIDPLLEPLLTSLPMQLLAYHVADLKGTDVDQPRNLAKSVTVE